jgi:hypothetical protein
LISLAALASPNGSIVGTIKDASGAPVGNAVVTAAHRTTTSDAAGNFTLADITPGSWSLSVEASGFKRTVASVAVQVDQSARADITLEIGDLSQTIEIIAAPPRVETHRSTISAVIDSATIENMPLNGRQYLDLALLIPGVLPAAPGTQGNGFSVAGIRSQSNVYLLDGVSNIDTQTNQPLNMFRITDAVAEFSVQTGVPLPEFGRGAGAQVNAVTRSGSNELHGSAFEYLRNTVFNAADFFTNKLGGQKSALNRNQFGGTAGGPVRRDQTFFFVSYEGFRQVAPTVSSVLVPTLAQRASVTDPISQRLLGYFPLPNTTGAVNYIANVRSRDSDDTALIRLDHQLGSRDRLSARWTQYRGESVAPGPTPLTGGNQGPLSQVSAMLDEEHTFSSRLWNDLRLGYSRFSMQRLPQDTGLNTAAIFAGANGEPIADLSGLPSITIGGGIAAVGANANFPQGRTANTVEAFDNVSFVLSRHTMRSGFHIRREDSARYLDRNKRGSITFMNFADFAGGLIMNSTFRTGSTQAYWRRYPWDLYWEDEFRLRANLTLVYGLRYEYPSAVNELRGHATNFVPGYGPMIAGTNSVLDIDPTRAGPASIVSSTAPFTLPRSGVYSDRNNFAPMAGFAWSPGLASVIHGGFRVGYDDLFNNVPSAMALAPPYNLQTTQQANVTQPGKFRWPLAFNQNVPLVSNYNQQGPGTPTVGIVTFQGLDTHLRSAYAYTYDFGIQRAIGRTISVEADYVGSSGHRLGVYVDQNQPAVIVRDPSRRGPVAPNEQIFPYNHFGLAQIAKSIGNSNYNGLALTARHRGRRSTLEVSYTLGKSLDYNSSYFGSGNLTGETGAPVDARNLRLDHGASAFDVRHRFVALFTANSPLGFRISGIATVQSGNPFTVVVGGPDTSGFNQVAAGNSPNGGNRPDLMKTGPVPQNNDAPDAAIDTSWFAPNLAGRDGMSGRNAYYGPGLVNFNLAVTKEFPLVRERTSLQLRAEFFNLLNHTNFAAPIADLNNANFGRITQTLGSAVATSVGTSGAPTGGPRIIQLSVRLRF